MCRDAAMKRGIFADYNALGEKDPATDKEVDEFQKNWVKKKTILLLKAVLLGILSPIL